MENFQKLLNLVAEENLENGYKVKAKIENFQFSCSLMNGIDMSFWLSFEYQPSFWDGEEILSSIEFKSGCPIDDLEFLAGEAIAFIEKELEKIPDWIESELDQLESVILDNRGEGSRDFFRSCRYDY